MVDLCLHIANVVYLASFLVRDMLRLRILTCVGLALGIIFFTCQSTPLYGPTAWHVVFLVINAFQIRRLVRERRQLSLTEEQARLGEAAFRDHSREELLALLTRAMAQGPEGCRNLDPSESPPLTRDEVVLRDIAFSRLSRQELLNLLTRRLWKSIARRKGALRFPRRRSAPTVDLQVNELETARSPMAG